MKCERIFMNTLIIAFVLLSLCEGRGGRRGGSFGGLFGSWRKYKKPSSGGGSSRRIVSSSPVHTPITKAWHDNKKPSNNDKFPKNIKANSYSNFNTSPLPTGGSYYHNTAALPGNAIYVAQAPPRGSEFGDFLTGYLTGRLLTMGFSSPHYHVTHVYRDNPAANENTANANSTSPKGIIINSQQTSDTEKPYNATLHDFTTTTEIPNTEEIEKPNNSLLVNFTTTTEISIKDDFDSSTTSQFSSTTESPAPLYGVICMPIMITETNEKGETVQTERTVCYPAPAPPTPQNDMKSKPVEIAGDIMEH